jgi:hypothetical protein
MFRRTGRTKTEDELDLLSARCEERVMSKALTFSYGGTRYCVNTGRPGAALRGVRVMMHHFVDDRLRLMYKDRILALTAYGTYPVSDAAADEKTLDACVDAVVAARKPAGAIVSGPGGGLKPGAKAPRCAALGLDPATTPGRARQMPLMTCFVHSPHGTFLYRVDSRLSFASSESSPAFAGAGSYSVAFGNMDRSPREIADRPISHVIIQMGA